MPYALAPGMSFCDADGQRIFLDLRRDRYFALGDAANDAFARLIGGETATAADHDRLSGLQAAGVLCAGNTLPTPCAAPPIRAALLDERDLPSPPLRATIGAALALRRAKQDVRCRSLEHLCAGFVEQRRGYVYCRDPDRVRAGVRLAIAFERAARLVGALDQCLALSFAIGRRGLALNLPVKLLLGVKARPFHAHAWVQLHDEVISDRLDNVRPYTPILVL